MPRRRANPQLVKIHRNYTVGDVADLFGAHKNTVRAWIRAGLPLIDNGRPALIHGLDLREFLYARRKKNRQTCPPGHIYCVKCRTPKMPAGDMADYIPFVGDNRQSSGHLSRLRHPHPSACQSRARRT